MRNRQVLVRTNVQRSWATVARRRAAQVSRVIALVPIALLAATWAGGNVAVAEVKCAPEGLQRQELPSWVAVRNSVPSMTIATESTPDRASETEPSMSVMNWRIASAIGVVIVIVGGVLSVVTIIEAVAVLPALSVAVASIS